MGWVRAVPSGGDAWESVGFEGEINAPVVALALRFLCDTKRGQGGWHVGESCPIPETEVRAQRAQESFPDARSADTLCVQTRGPVVLCSAAASLTVPASLLHCPRSEWHSCLPPQSLRSFVSSTSPCSLPSRSFGPGEVGSNSLLSFSLGRV